MAPTATDTETGRKTARVSPKVAKRIGQVMDTHLAHDERHPPRAWRQPTDREQIDQEVLGLIDHYESIAPHLSAPTLKALRRMFRAHPHMRLRGQEYSQAEPNYKLPNGKKFYWGGVRRLADGSLREGGVGRKPRILEEYEQSPAGQKRIAQGEPTFTPIA